MKYTYGVAITLVTLATFAQAYNGTETFSKQRLDNFGKALKIFLTSIKAPPQYQYNEEKWREFENKLIERARQSDVDYEEIMMKLKKKDVKFYEDINKEVEGLRKNLEDVVKKWDDAVKIYINSTQLQFQVKYFAHTLKNLADQWVDITSSLGGDPLMYTMNVLNETISKISKMMEIYSYNLSTIKNRLRLA